MIPTKRFILEHKEDIFYAIEPMLKKGTTDIKELKYRVCELLLNNFTTTASYDDIMEALEDQVVIGILFGGEFGSDRRRH